MAQEDHDVIIVGAGIAGLWTAAVLTRAGYDVVVVSDGPAGGVQTLASQGMIHGGQKYALDAGDAATAARIAALPQRWETCFDGCGDLDLTSVRFLSDHQVMWPAGGIVAGAAVFAAAKAVNAATAKMKSAEYPDALAHLRGRKFKGAVWRLPEKVLEVKTLISALSKGIEDRIVRGTVEQVLPDGQILVSGKALRARAIVFAAGLGNERALELLKLPVTLAQRRPLKQVMIRALPHALHGHGVVASPKPRVTVTSHPDDNGGYVWYLGGGVAEAGAKLSETETLRFAISEMTDMFPDIDWAQKEWAVLPIDRAEARSDPTRVAAGPQVHQRGRILIAWPSKLTFAPMLGDMILGWLKDKDIMPSMSGAAPSLNALPRAGQGDYPWASATWAKIGEVA